MSEPAAPRCRILVIGIGNPDRGDDGIGALVVQGLAGKLAADVTLMSRCGDILSAIEDWNRFDALICVDAAAPMGAPGSVHRIDLATDELPHDFSFTSSHALGLAEAVALARALRCAPRHIVVYAVEGICFDVGAPISPALSAVQQIVADRIVGEIDRLRERVERATFANTVGGDA